MLDSEYTLAYYPPPTTHKLRKIDVKVNHHGLRVLANRSTVPSNASDDTVRYLGGTCTVSPTFYVRPYEPHLRGAPGKEIYRDDFSDPHSGWPTHPESHYVSRGYELSTAEQAEQSEGVRVAPMVAASMGVRSEGVSVMKYRQDVIAAYGPPWPDFRVSATMKADYEPRSRSDAHDQFVGPVPAAGGLVFRLTWKGYYALLVGPSVKNKKALAFELVARSFRGDSYAESVIVPWTTVPQDTPSEAELGVQDVGDQVTIFIDGRQVGMARDDTFTDGYAGFIVSAPAHAAFSNFVLQQK